MMNDSTYDVTLGTFHAGVDKFVADNPGRWLFHCHNFYHLEVGMAREVRYV